MCGIAGYILRHGRADPEIVQAQLKLLKHRGPDAVGVYAQGRAAIGQTRLAIIDLETGDPPITADDAMVGAVLNGELYNYRALRDQLESCGHTLVTSGDTEVLAHLGQQPPAQWIRSLEGMFAASIWDARRERLTLLRDRVGKKPLYWWRGPDLIVFASEIKALLAHPRVPIDLDERAIPSHLHLGYVPTPSTFFRGIESVPPGHVVTIDSALNIEVQEYWSRPVHIGPRASSMSLTDSTNLVRSMLRTAVSDRLVADVPVGAFLSGGVDSAVIVGLMADVSATQVATFTVGFENSEFDERDSAREVADHFGTNHHEFVLRPDAVSLIDDLVQHHDQPFGDSSAVPMWLISKETANQVKVVLSGDGGDEVFAGYRRMTAGVVGATLAQNRLARRLCTPLATVAAGIRRTRPKLALLAASAVDPMPTMYRELTAYASAQLVESLATRPTDALESYERLWASTEGARPLDRILDLNFRTYLLDDLLPKIDRMSMAHALEVRSPLLDHRLIEHVASLPPNLLHHRGRRKRLLREVASGLVPAAVLQRPKRGFGVPLTTWFRTSLARHVELTLGTGARVRAYVDPKVLDRVVSEHLSGGADHRDLLWCLLTLESFLAQRQW